MTTEHKTLSSLVDRHHHDPKFHALTEMLVAYMMQNQIAPDELRDAAYVASIKFMQLRPCRELIYTDDLHNDPA